MLVELIIQGVSLFLTDARVALKYLDTRTQTAMQELMQISEDVMSVLLGVLVLIWTDRSYPGPYSWFGLYVWSVRADW